MSIAELEVTSHTRVLDRRGVDALLQALRESGYTLVGPRVRDQAIVYDEIESTADLPVGLTDEQEAGRYRLKPRGDGALFGYVVGPHSWKKYLFPADQKLYSHQGFAAACDAADQRGSPLWQSTISYFV